MHDGFVKVAATSPNLKVADCTYNAEQIIATLQKANSKNIKLLVLPELCITGYTCGDLFNQRSLQQGALSALQDILTASKHLDLIATVGLPMVIDNKLYNIAAVFSKGVLLGLVPKTYLPNYAEFYEMRHFCAGSTEIKNIYVLGQTVPFGTSLLFRCEEMPAFTLGVEICEDVWSALPPSTFHAIAGATVIANLSASDETVGKVEYRNNLIQNQSARLLCAYIYADASHGESTTDMVFAGHNIIAENGAILAQSLPFGSNYAATEIDCERIESERVKNTSFQTTQNGYETIPFSLNVSNCELTRFVSPTPFVPGDETARAKRCALILNMQADGLAKRIEHARAKTAIIGISGGLDSCLALLVAVEAMRILNRPNTEIIAVTMPCFGTTKRTRSNAEILCNELGVTFKEITIGDTVNSHFDDIEQDKTKHDVTFENGQARVRTLVLMNLANKLSGLVVGTGDLSELALGWATYNGDHMSMYGVNAGVPKTLVRHIVHTQALNAKNTILRDVLIDILNTPVSPELLPADENGEIAQQTEEIVGPYELHDFYLYYVLRFGFTPAKIYRLASIAFANRGEYTPTILYKWLRNFYWRFFAQQFKRSCLPDGPKIGSVTLSPRGDWRMPSDASSALWLAELDTLKKELELS